MVAIPAIVGSAMKSGALRRAFGLTLLYIGGFVLLVLLQFSRGPGFSEKFGRLAVNASFPKVDRGAAGRTPDSVRLDFAGFAIELSARSPARLIASDGSSHVLAPRSIEKRNDGVRIALEGGVELFASGGKDDRYSLSANVPPGTSALRLMYSLAGRASLSIAGEAGKLVSAGASYDIAIPSSVLDTSAGFLTFRASAAEGAPFGRFSMAMIPEAPGKPGKPGGPAKAERLAAQTPKDPTAFKVEIDAWRDKAWAGLSSGRYDAERLAWRGRAGGIEGARFSEKALAAYLAESLARGTYTDALGRMRPAKERYPAELGYLSAPYLGGFVKKMEALEEADLGEVRRLSQLVQDKSPELFTKEGVVRFLLDRAPRSLAQDALQFAATLDPSKLTVRQAVGLLGCIADARSLLKDEENSFRSLGAAADRVASSVRASPSGLFLASEEDGSTDLRLSLLAGQYLVAFGTAEGRNDLLGLGQGLVEGFLGLADDEGIAPARLLVREGSIDQKTGTLLPEEVYTLLAANAFYPHEVSFYRDLAPGVWAWTCSPSLSVSATDTKYVFTAAFPEGRSHYLVFYGIKPFTNIQLYDIDYSPDAEFEIYDASGYLYKKPSGALYMKMKHKKESETVKLFF
jgi:hypothetical protein